jgi:hypothetical protein
MQRSLPRQMPSRLLVALGFRKIGRWQLYQIQRSLGIPPTVENEHALYRPGVAARQRGGTECPATSSSSMLTF